MKFYHIGRHGLFRGHLIFLPKGQHGSLKMSRHLLVQFDQAKVSTQKYHHYTRPSTLKTFYMYTPKGKTHFENRLLKSDYACGAFGLNITRSRSLATSVAARQNDENKIKPFSEMPGPTTFQMMKIMMQIRRGKGEAAELQLNPQPFMAAMLDTYGPVVRVKFNEVTVLAEDPDDIETVFKNEGKYPRRQPIPLIDILASDLGKKAIGNAQGEDWHKVRSPLNPLLMRPKSAQHYLPAQNEVADDLVARLRKPFQSEELAQIFYRYACESICVVAYNKRLGYLDPDIDPEKLQPLEDIRTMFNAITESFKYNPIILKYFPLKVKRRFKEAASRVDKNTKRFYQEAMAEIGDEPKVEDADQDNFLRSLLTSGRMDANGMASIANSLFIAGTDSTARNLHLVIYNLALHPDKQRKLYDEITRVIGPDGELTQQAMDSMKFLVACVKESFRLLYPTSVGTQRYLANDVVLSGYRVPAGTNIMLMNQRTVKNPKYFPDPHSFLPERWLRDEEGKRETPVPSFAHIPFGFGPRMCVGKRFAEQEIYLALVKLIQNFEIGLDKDQGDVRVVYLPFAGPRDPINFIFTERK